MCKNVWKKWGQNLCGLVHPKVSCPNLLCLCLGFKQDIGRCWSFIMDQVWTCGSSSPKKHQVYGQMRNDKSGARVLCEKWLAEFGGWPLRESKDPAGNYQIIQDSVDTKPPTKNQQLPFDWSWMSVLVGAFKTTNQKSVALFKDESCHHMAVAPPQRPLETFGTFAQAILSVISSPNRDPQCSKKSDSVRFLEDNETKCGSFLCIQNLPSGL